MKILGRHILVEFYECIKDTLSDIGLIKKYMEEAAINSKATIVDSTFHQFSPHGVSGVVVIAESHLAIHTWPEYNYAAVDLFTCGSEVDPWVAFNTLKDRLGAFEFSTKEINRGLPDPGAITNIHIRHKPHIADQ